MKVINSIEVEINAVDVFNGVYLELVEIGLIPGAFEKPKVSWEINSDVFHVKYFMEKEN